jgi:hypothetical protein
MCRSANAYASVLFVLQGRLYIARLPSVYRYVLSTETRVSATSDPCSPSLIRCIISIMRAVFRDGSVSYLNLALAAGNSLKERWLVVVGGG